MPDISTNKVLSIISGPTRRTEKVITIEKRWLDGVFQGEIEKPPYERVWWEVLVKADMEWVGEKDHKFECPTEDKAKEIVPGLKFNS